MLDLGVGQTLGSILSLAKVGCRPDDLDRCGFSLGEGNRGGAEVLLLRQED